MNHKNSILSNGYFHNEGEAYKYVEGRLWPRGPICPHCGGMEKNRKMGGKSTRIGVYKCYDCRKQFTVKIGTIFEASHIPMNVWLQAIFLIASSKKGISSNQLHRMLGVTLKSAWFLSHRIREAMKDGGLNVFGIEGTEVEIDETFIGRDYDKKPRGDKKADRAGMMVSPTAARKAGEQFGRAPVGAGEYRLARWTPGSEVRLERFAEYWEPGRPYLDALVFRIMADGDTRVSALRSGQVDFIMEVPSQDFPALKGERGLRTHEALTLAWWPSASTWPRHRWTGARSGRR